MRCGVVTPQTVGKKGGRGKGYSHHVHGSDVEADRARLLGPDEEGAHGDPVVVPVAECHQLAARPILELRRVRQRDPCDGHILPKVQRPGYTSVRDVQASKLRIGCSKCISEDSVQVRQVITASSSPMTASLLFDTPISAQNDIPGSATTGIDRGSDFTCADGELRLCGKDF